MSLALLRTGCLSTLCFSNQLGGISAWMKVSETSILAWRKNQTDGCYARVPHASPCPGASLLKSDPVCSRNEPLFLNSNDQTGRSQSKQGSKKVFTDYCIPMGRTLCSKLAHVFFTTSLQGRYQYSHSTVRETEATGPRSPRIRTQDCWTPEPQVAYSLPTTARNPSLVIYQLTSPSRLLLAPLNPIFLLSFLLQVIIHIIYTSSPKQRWSNHFITKVAHPKQPVCNTYVYCHPLG